MASSAIITKSINDLTNDEKEKNYLGNSMCGVSLNDDLIWKI